MRELIIAGAGPAGITAAIYAARKRLDFMILTNDIGGQTVWSSGMENYTGYQFITGAELAMKFNEHLSQFQVELKQDEPVRLLERFEDSVRITTDKGVYEARTAIIATGREPRKLGVVGEDEFRGRGVTYCATCDGPLYRDRDVAVIGGGNSALDAVLQLIKIASRVYLINIGSELTADPIMVEKAAASPLVKIYNNARTIEIKGGDSVSGIVILHNNEKIELGVEGVFIEIGSNPVSSFAKGITRTPAGEIIVNCRCETNFPNVFAAGDVTSVMARQIIVACGEGAKAAIAASEYLARRR